MQSLLKPGLLFKIEFKTEFGFKDAATLVSFALEGNQTGAIKSLGCKGAQNAVFLRCRQ
jgi:hypothetical protein